jgi:hypothetical protein
LSRLTAVDCRRFQTRINGIRALTKLFSAKKTQKTTSNLLALLRRISALTKLFSAKKNAENNF